MKILIDATEITPNRRFASIPIYINRYLSAIPKVERENYLLLINPGCESFFCINYPEFKTITYKFRGWNKYWHHNYSRNSNLIWNVHIILLLNHNLISLLF